MDRHTGNKSNIPFFGYMTERGPVVVSSPDMASFEAFKAINVMYTSSVKATNDGGDDMEKRIAILEVDVAGDAANLLI